MVTEFFSDDFFIPFIIQTRDVLIRIIGLKLEKNIEKGLIKDQFEFESLEIHIKFKYTLLNKELLIIQNEIFDL